MHRPSTFGRVIRPRRSLAIGAVLVSLVILAPGAAVVAKDPPAAACQHGLLSAHAPADGGTDCLAATVAPLVTTALASGFTETVALSGLTNPTNLEFAADGRVFVAEKSGIIKVFDDLADTTPTVFSTLTTNVQNYWDRGLLGLALDPSLTDPTLPLRPWIYVLYTYDHILGDPASGPRWGDACASPPGPTTDGCVVSARLSRFSVSGSTISGPEQVLIEDWCQQFPSHSIGTLAFGADGALYVSGGDGANFNAIDYGQFGGSLTGTPTPKNPCADPPGGAMTPPAAEGGALRSQDLRSGGGSGAGAYAASVLADSPVAYWRLGESSGTTAIDATGGDNGTYSGGVTRSQPGALSGDTDTAVAFDGSTGQIDIADSNALDLGDGPFTFELWAKRSNANSGYQLLYAKGSQGNVFFFNNKFSFDNDGDLTAVESGTTIDSNWHHFVVSRVGAGAGKTRIYKDGVDVTVEVNIGQGNTSNAVAPTIGIYVDHAFAAFGGTLDEVAIYPSALSASRVAAHFAAALTPASGGADPIGLDGAILRVDPVTGAGFAGNPLAASADTNARRIIAYGLRNPFRFALRPGTNELWLGDVGWNTWEEIDRIGNVSDGVVEDFGWPCYEGSGRQSAYDTANLALCEDLYATGSGAITAPVYTYNHASTVVAGETCPTGSSAIAGMVFYPTAGGSFPASYRGGLFFADHNRSCIWFIPNGTNGQPDPTQRQTFAAGAPNPVDLTIGPSGDLFYVDFDGSTIRRISPIGTNGAPTARILATPESGPAPLTVAFDGRTSSDPEGGALTYRWDLDGDLAYDDSTSATPSFSYPASGTVSVGLEVTDPGGATGTATKLITIGPTNAPPVPVISAPVAGTTWGVGDPDPILFSGSATDPEDGVLPPAALTWTLVLQHCPSNCHTHQIQTFPGVSSGSFFPPDHDYPSYLELTLTATDSAGASGSVTRRLDPRTVNLSFQTGPTGLQLTVGSSTQAAPFIRTVIDGSRNSISAPTPQDLGGIRYGFPSWSDAGAAAHDVTARAGGTYTATYLPISTDISVTKTGIRSGSTLTFTITVANVKGTTAQGVAMTDVLNSKLVYQSATSTIGTCSLSGATVSCAVGSLGAGEQAVITLVTRASKLSGSVTNTATVTTSTLELTTTNNTSTVSVRLR